MVAFINLKVECSMNRNSTMTAKVYDPSAEQQAELVEGADIVIPMFDGVLFSGEITRVNKKQMTPDDATEHYYMWEIEATSDQIKLANINIGEAQVGTFLGYTAGQLINGILPSAWRGDIDLTGPVINYTSSMCDVSTFIGDLVSQAGFDFRTRRDYIRYDSTAYQQFGPSPPYIDEPYSAIGVDDVLDEGEYEGFTLMFVTGAAAYKTCGTIFWNYSGTIYAVLENPTLPVAGDTFIVIRNPVFDAKPLMSEDAPVKTLKANEELLKFEAIDDKSDRFTKVICTGRGRSGESLSSTLSAVFADESACTYTAYRGDSVLFQDARAGDTTVYVKGYSIKPVFGDHISIRSGGSSTNYTVSSTGETGGPNGELVTWITFSSGMSKTYPAGSPVYYENSKIYVEDRTKVTSPIWIGDEKIAFSGTGSDANGDYVNNVVRGQSGGSAAYDHPIGVLVRSGTYTELNPEPGSPYADYGQRIKMVNTSAVVTRGELDRLCTTLLPRGANIINTGEGQVPLNFFWKITNAPDPGYVPLEVGDVITVSTGGVPTGNYVLQSYTVDFDKCMVTVRLGDYDQGIIYKIRDLQETLQRQLS